MVQSINPYTLEILKEHKETTPEDLNYLIVKADNAFRDWQRFTFAKRGQILKRVSSLLKKETERYAVAITREMGKPIKESRAEVQKCAWVCEYYAENAVSFLTPKEKEIDENEAVISFEPLGVILGIMPWNYPFWQVFRWAAPTLMAGNTCILKHASGTFICADLIEEVFKEAGIPDGGFIHLRISSSNVEDVLRHPRVQGVSLTGSVGAGAAVASLAGKHIKKSLLELGGSNSFIVLDDADIFKAAETGVKARMMNGGQSCIAAKRFIVHRAVIEEYLNKYLFILQKTRTGDPMDTDTTLGPLSSVDQAIKVEKQVNDSIKAGAKLVTGGKRVDAFFEPTVLTGVKPGMPAFDEEIFGPVASFIEISNDQEAADLSNQSDFGLGVSICTTNRERAVSLASRIEDGAVFINELVKSDPRLPFGGTKKSGYGRELSEFGILEFVNIKTIFIKNH